MGVRRVLIVDDSTDYREAARDALAELDGVEVVAPDNLEVCLSIAFDIGERVAVVLLDNNLNHPLFQEISEWNTEGYRGWQFADRLKDECPDLVRIAFSLSNRFTLTKRCQRAFDKKGQLVDKDVTVRQEAREELKRVVAECLASEI